MPVQEFEDALRGLVGVLRASGHPVVLQGDNLPAARPFITYFPVGDDPVSAFDGEHGAFVTAQVTAWAGTLSPAAAAASTLLVPLAAARWHRQPGSPILRDENLVGVARFYRYARR